MSIKFTDAQLLMLSAAAQREDRILAMPPNLKGGAAKKVAAKLIAAGLVKEIKAKTEAPSWRRDAETGQSFALKLTAAGLKASATDKGMPASKAAEPGCQSACKIDPLSACKIGSDALLMTIGSRGADDARLEQIEFSSSIHLALDQLELADLAFGLAVGPT